MPSPAAHAPTARTPTGTHVAGDLAPVTSWRLMRSPPMPAAENMALDEALLARARATGETVFRVYTWTRPTLSLGRNQTALGLYDAARAAAMSVDVVRRPTGGRAVLHAREVTYSVTAPAAEALRVAYARINQLLLDGLRRLGVDARLAEPAGRSPLPTGAPCFEAPVAGEIVVGSRKLVGSAQYRDHGAFLQHGSILIDDDQTLLARLALRPLPYVPPAATLHETLGRVPDVGEVASALFAAVRAHADARATALPDEAEVGAVAREAVVQYRDPAWTWRR
jgi:lipoyl(octanoyl) transferase